MSEPSPSDAPKWHAAAAVAAAIAAGRGFLEAAEGINSAEVSRWRMQLMSVLVGDGQVVVVNDAYNANPDSMRSALETVASRPGRRFAVLGKMHELGDYEVEAHREAGAMAASLGFRVFAVGEDPGLAEGAGRDAESVPGPEQAVARLRQELQGGDVVLVKASRAAGLESIADELQEMPA